MPTAARTAGTAARTARTAGTANALADLGQVERRPQNIDRRLVVVHLTDLGRVTVLADRRRRDAWLARRLRDLSPEEREVLRRAAPLLERLSTA